jgi:DNA modification methylase
VGHLRVIEQADILAETERLDQALHQVYADKFRPDPFLSRPLVSFQANKDRPVYRWYKFKEAFSAALVEYLLDTFHIERGTLLDPFAGSGTALFAASARGIAAHGIELLPVGQQIITARQIIFSDLTPDDWTTLKRWQMERPWQTSASRVALPELRITKGAYSPQTQAAIEHYLGACQLENQRARAVLQLALLAVLESVSYTRKDGQYLRWDYRSGRRQGKKRFDKGRVLAFEDAILAKLEEIIEDSLPTVGQLELLPTRARGDIKLFTDSCLDVLPQLAESAYDAIITSPPYCNRYDYTRTYALELALLRIGERQLVQLRQHMLSATVENRAKDLLMINPRWEKALAVADQQNLLQVILRYLDDQKTQGKLNNSGIPRMVRGYFYEMACVIAECARVLKPGAPLLMVNDNVRYAGASLSVDLILADLAAQLGFTVEAIWVLPNGKGNSSQQMGIYGRSPLRKCLYIWRKQ